MGVFQEGRFEGQAELGLVKGRTIDRPHTSTHNDLLKLAANSQRDLLEEAVIVNLVIIVFLFHFHSALIAILALSIAVLVSFIPMYWLT